VLSLVLPDEGRPLYGLPCAIECFLRLMLHALRHWDLPAAHLVPRRLFLQLLYLSEMHECVIQVGDLHSTHPGAVLLRVVPQADVLLFLARWNSGPAPGPCVRRAGARSLHGHVMSQGCLHLFDLLLHVFLPHTLYIYTIQHGKLCREVLTKLHVFFLAFLDVLEFYGCEALVQVLKQLPVFLSIEEGRDQRFLLLFEGDKLL
jgi:hypothetical protein